MPLIRFLFVAVPVIRRFLRSRQGKAAMAKGKAQHDKRDTEKKRDWEREKGRLMRHKVGGKA